MSKKLKQIIKSKVSDLLNEGFLDGDQFFGNSNDAETLSKTGSVTGDKGAAHAAGASIHGDKMRDNLRSMGVGVPNIEHIHTVDELKSGPFSIKFTIQGKLDKWGERPSKSFTTKAILYKNLSEKYKTIILKTKDGWHIKFDPSEIITPLTGTKTKVNALVDGQKYNIKIGGTFDVTVLNESKIYKTEMIIEKIETEGSVLNRESKPNYINVTGVITNPNSATWLTKTVLGTINKILKDGVRARKSTHSNRIILEWDSTETTGLPTKALVIEDDVNNKLWNRLNGAGFLTKVTIGKKPAGNDGISDELKDIKIQLKKK